MARQRGTVGWKEISEDIPAGLDRVSPSYSFSAKNLLNRTTISQLWKQSCTPLSATSSLSRMFDG
jgi:hypothetical protein